MYSDELMRWIREHMEFIDLHSCADYDDPYDFIKFAAINAAAEELAGEYFPDNYCTSKYEQIFSLCINNKDEALKLLKFWYSYHIIGG